MFGALESFFRNKKGKPMAASTKVIEGPNDPRLAEMMAIKYKVKLAIDCYFQEVEFEIDCKTLAENLNTGEGIINTCGMMCEIINNLRRTRVNYNNRVNKGVTHILANTCNPNL